MSKFDGRAIVRERAARFCVEAFCDPAGFKTRQEWIEALDETLTDLCHSYGKEPKVSIWSVLQEIAAA